MAMIEVVCLLDELQIVPFNTALSQSVILPTPLFSRMHVLLWVTTSDPLTDPHDWRWFGWLLTLAEADELTGVVMEARGPVNDNSPAGKGSYYRSDEAQTGASLETAPVGGWTLDLILADLIRKRFAYQVLDDPGPP